jgi:hypothetical protein
VSPQSLSSCADVRVEVRIPTHTQLLSQFTVSVGSGFMELARSAMRGCTSAGYRGNTIISFSNSRLQRGVGLHKMQLYHQCAVHLRSFAVAIDTKCRKQMQLHALETHDTELRFYWISRDLQPVSTTPSSLPLLYNTPLCNLVDTSDTP